MSEQEVNESGRPPRTTIPLIPDFENGKIVDLVAPAWDWLFGIFYNREPTFDDQSLGHVLACVMRLIDCAESIGSIDHVRDIVDLALVRQDNVLWHSIMSSPVVWIELGRRVRSPQIYSEAAVHLIGQWGTIDKTDQERISQDIRAILQRKADELQMAKEVIEMRILGHYPQFMSRSAVDKPGRPSYSNDIYMWMSVCFFRQWFAQNISDDRSRRAPDGGLAFYASIHEGGQAYLTHLDFKQFHQYFPMSIKACHVLETNMGVLKEDLKKYVADLMIERTHLKRADHPIDWLTCAVVDKEDYPWYVAPPPTQEDKLQILYDALDDENNRAAAAQDMDMGMGMVKANGKPRVIKTDTTTPTATPNGGKKRARPFDDEDSECGDDGMFIPEDLDDAMEEDIF